MAHALQGAVLGHPIGHSKSPVMHRSAYAELGLDYRYSAVDLEVPALAAFLEEVRADGNWYGLSVTMPLKNRAAELVDTLTPAARALGSVNTVVVTRTDDGGTHLLGDNTDVAGLVNALRHAGAPELPRAAVLGGGGTAVSAVAALAELGAPAIDIYVRNPDKAAATLEVARRLGVPASLLPYSGAAAALAGYGVVISTLPPHAPDALAADVAAAGAATAGHCLLDVAYDPWPSALAAAWERCGGTVVPGIEMLLYQGVEQVKLFAAAGGFADVAGRRAAGVLDVMCDALGLSRRPPHN
ncbi:MULTISPECIES: shikimate dehydrogenase [unclassified Arthrobacter]|uniref:shikimate dehydrogenase n=1 Tax=unclassified Arthrobacter TaxID=235627 RepID=UPI00159DB817|nr:MULTISPECIES: shikimate dehydrogenase [unclassified Arthrobacter]MCQ9164372.1 shikimate dehydrogenase [Arthrobacter sp. STN4]NVM97916.1 shikimate dehydrogenase [Arthrobacter sp. SDTb3-6]